MKFRILMTLSLLLAGTTCTYSASLEAPPVRSKEEAIDARVSEVMKARSAKQQVAEQIADKHHSATRPPVADKQVEGVAEQVNRAAREQAGQQPQVKQQLAGQEQVLAAECGNAKPEPAKNNDDQAPCAQVTTHERSSSSTSEIADAARAMRTLFAMRKEGLITPEEFSRRKERIIWGR